MPFPAGAVGFPPGRPRKASSTALGGGRPPLHGPGGQACRMALLSPGRQSWEDREASPKFLNLSPTQHRVRGWGSNPLHSAPGPCQPQSHPRLQSLTSLSRADPNSPQAHPARILYSWRQDLAASAQPAHPGPPRSRLAESRRRTARGTVAPAAGCRAPTADTSRASMVRPSPGAPPGAGGELCGAQIFALGLQTCRAGWDGGGAGGQQSPRALHSQKPGPSCRKPPMRPRLTHHPAACPPSAHASGAHTVSGAGPGPWVEV